ncbi:MAG TPA: exodeoxyribonuclease VII small subunit [Nitrosomonas sp.]|nr:exodeoxyribonuclease VII small subunit [Nitrosomonas sp.]HMV12079.1 exodeoxyribonuclease VII small subunit [Nitrosomonas sp.]HMW20562.1 exodeoxyribonuclease VII small subunit [Nitrosomonas sp.]HMW68360.1 exodeoxyribonuclease VII small subunit [Nitrosomonas sp.]HMY61081.1 exodeoxyribonuclease VII small subunit [Nitrosomonas sp.]
MKKKTTETLIVEPESFEAASAELESIVIKMESGQMTLEASLAAYKRGMELLQYCQKALQNAQQQIRVLEDGNLRDFTETESINER